MLVFAEGCSHLRTTGLKVVSSNTAMDLGALFYVITSIIFVSLSGALAPGPLTVATIIAGSNGGARSGLLIAIGHTIVEFPYVFLLVLLANRGIVEYITGNFTLKVILAVIALVFILYFGYLTFVEGYNIVRKGELSVSSLNTKSRFSGIITNPLIVGIVLTGLNPQFLAWWATIGLSLILSVAKYVNILQFLPIFYISHVWIDYAWLISLAYLSRKGVLRLGRKYGYVLEVLAIVLVILGVLIVVSLMF